MLVEDILNIYHYIDTNNLMSPWLGHSFRFSKWMQNSQVLFEIEKICIFNSVDESKVILGFYSDPTKITYGKREASYGIYFRKRDKKIIALSINDKYIYNENMSVANILLENIVGRTKTKERLECALRHLWIQIL